MELRYTLSQYAGDPGPNLILSGNSLEFFELSQFFRKEKNSPLQVSALDDDGRRLQCSFVVSEDENESYSVEKSGLQLTWGLASAEEAAERLDHLVASEGKAWNSLDLRDHRSEAFSMFVLVTA